MIAPYFFLSISFEYHILSFDTITDYGANTFENWQFYGALLKMYQIIVLTHDNDNGYFIRYGYHDLLAANIVVDQFWRDHTDRLIWNT